MVVGPNGAGKTNLLEALHLALQGFSPRTRRDTRAIRFGASAARVTAAGTLAGGRPFATEVTLQADGAKRLVVDGARAAGVDGLRAQFPVLAFTPDRLAVVKGPPAIRRAYLDRVVGRILPARAELPAEYGRALAQRNAALRRVRAGLAGRDTVAPWTEAVVRLGVDLDAARSEAVRAVAPGFGAQAAALGLRDAALAYGGATLSAADLEARLDRDVERGLTGSGPHLCDVAITAETRDLRSFGSQGEQRTAVLALVLAEAEVLTRERGEPPLLLLDDVLSELDDARRTSLAEAIPSAGQAVLTATSLRSLPASAPAPGAVVDVTPGRAAVR